MLTDDSEYEGSLSDGEISALKQMLDAIIEVFDESICSKSQRKSVEDDCRSNRAITERGKKMTGFFFTTVGLFTYCPLR